MADTTATYIGLRTYRYAPVTTSRSVGATGAGVPRPSRTKRTNALTRRGRATTRSTAPSTRTGAAIGWLSHRVNHHGTSPTTTPGASAKKSALPSAARRRRMQALRLPRRVLAGGGPDPDPRHRVTG